MSPRTMRTDDDLSAEARLTAAEMSHLLEYDSDEEQVATTATEEDSTDSPKPSSPILKSNTSGGVLDSSVGGKTNWTTGSELDSVTLLKRLGSNPTETEMARIAVTRTRESISDCFSVGVGKKCSFEEIPSYNKDELLIGQHLGKGSFSDVFEAMVTQKALSSKVAIKATICEDIETLANSDGRRKPQRRSSMSGSVCVGSMGRPQFETVTALQGKRTTLAMKCLRPQARSNFDHFLVGVEDLIHETAILSTLDHPNIIKLWGRAGDASSFKLSDGYFILVDKLQDTLQDRIDRWAKDYPNARKNAPSLSQIKVACDISDALSYLHMSNIVFRDLKPANVGFDANGQLKLFDFGFAAIIASEDDNESNPRVLNDICGTLRYMAPEVSAALDYGKEVDVYSFGILLWEICAAKKPFSKIKSTRDFKNKVYGEEERPKLGKYWPGYLKDLMQKCWSNDPAERPTMTYVKSMLTSSVCEMKSKPTKESSSFGGSLRRSFVMTRRSSFQ